MRCRSNPSNTPNRSRLVTRPSDGVIEARNTDGRLVAHFNPHTNQTRNHRGDLIGTGNRLPAVLRELDQGSAPAGGGGK